MLFNSAARWQVSHGMVYPGSRCGRRPIRFVGPPRTVRTLGPDHEREFKLCEMSNKNLAALGLGMGLTTMLIVMSSSGPRVEGWLWSILMLVALLLVLVVGPAIFCRFLIKSYVNARASRTEGRNSARANADTQTQVSIGDIGDAEAELGFANSHISSFPIQQPNLSVMIPMPVSPSNGLPTYAQVCGGGEGWKRLSEAVPPEYSSLDLPPPPPYSSESSLSLNFLHLSIERESPQRENNSLPPLCRSETL